MLPLDVFLTPYPLHRLIVEEEDEECYEPRPEWAKASEHCVCWGGRGGVGGEECIVS